jgi:hypothetical protein
MPTESRMRKPFGQPHHHERDEGADEHRDHDARGGEDERAHEHRVEDGVGEDVRVVLEPDPFGRAPKTCARPNSWKDVMMSWMSGHPVMRASTMIAGVSSE